MAEIYPFAKLILPNAFNSAIRHILIPLNIPAIYMVLFMTFNFWYSAVANLIFGDLYNHLYY